MNVDSLGIGKKVPAGERTTIVGHTFDIKSNLILQEGIWSTPLPSFPSGFYDLQIKPRGEIELWNCKATLPIYKKLLSPFLRSQLATNDDDSYRSKRWLYGTVVLVNSFPLLFGTLISNQEEPLPVKLVLKCCLVQAKIANRLQSAKIDSLEDCIPSGKDLLSMGKQVQKIQVSQVT